MGMDDIADEIDGGYLFLAALPLLLLGICMQSYICYPYRYRCIELVRCMDPPRVNTLRSVELFGLVVTCLAIILLIASGFMFESDLLVVIYFSMLACWGFGTYIYARESVDYTKLPEEAVVTSAIGYQIAFDPPFPNGAV